MKLVQCKHANKIHALMDKISLKACVSLRYGEEECHWGVGYIFSILVFVYITEGAEVEL